MNWVSNIRRVLCTNGLAFVWENQGVGHVSSVLKVFKQRLIDCRWQQWNSHIDSSERLSFYKRFKTVNEVEPYLWLNLDRHLICVMSRFRTGISDIAVHSFRYKNHSNADVICPLCKIEAESEIHFALCCTALDDLRRQFIQPKYFDNPDIFHLVQLLTTANEHILKDFAMFLYTAFKRRRFLVSAV